MYVFQQYNMSVYYNYPTFAIKPMQVKGLKDIYTIELNNKHASIQELAVILEQLR